RLGTSAQGSAMKRPGHAFEPYRRHDQPGTLEQEGAVGARLAAVVAAEKLAFLGGGAQRQAGEAAAFFRDPGGQFRGLSRRAPGHDVEKARQMEAHDHEDCRLLAAKALAQRDWLPGPVENKRDLLSLAGGPSGGEQARLVFGRQIARSQVPV